MALNVSSYFQYYIFHPTKLPEEIDRNMVAISSIALGILTLGLLHIICYAAFYNRDFVVKTPPGDQENKTKEVFDKNILIETEELESEDIKENKPPKVETLPKTNIPRESVEEKDLEIHISSQHTKSTEDKTTEQKKPPRKPRRRGKRKKIHRQKTPIESREDTPRTNQTPQIKKSNAESLTNGEVKLQLPLKHLHHTPPEDNDIKPVSSTVVQAKSPVEGEKKTSHKPKRRQKSHKHRQATSNIKGEQNHPKKPVAPLEGGNPVVIEPKFVKFRGKSEVRLESAKKWGEEGQREYQILLGGLYLFGRSGVKKSGKSAAYWYTKAANQHKSPLAQYRLGKMYMGGIGVPRSRRTGLFLLNASSEQGYSNAKKYLEKHKLSLEQRVRFKTPKSEELQETKN